MSLIVGIILAFLARTGKRREFGAIWTGVAGAVALSLLAGGVILVTAGEFRGRAEQLFEGVAMITAVGVLTYMVFWMRRQAATIRSELHSRLGDALRTGSRGALIYRGSRRLDLRTFFNVTSVLLLLVGAGLLARGVGEFQEAAILPPLVAHLWDMHAAIPETSVLGSLLQAVFGYISTPSLLQVAMYLAYLAVVGWSYVRPPAVPAGRPGTDGVRRADAPAHPKG